MIRAYVVTTQMDYDPTSGRQAEPVQYVVSAYTAADAIAQADLECSRGGYYKGAGEGGPLVHYRPRVIAVRPAKGLEGSYAGIFDSF